MTHEQIEYRNYVLQGMASYGGDVAQALRRITMKYSEATKAIQGLSKKYSINNDDKCYFEIIYKSKSIAWVNKQEQFNFDLERANVIDLEFDRLPYIHKLWMILAELSMTPLDKRKNEHKWNVIIGNNDNYNGSIIVWEKSISNNGYVLNIDYPNDLSCYLAVFTDSEFSDLIKYIKTLPEGEWQAKVAEHGKTEVKSEDGEDYTGAGRQPD